MAEKLFALLCVAEVSADTLSKIISTAYENETDSAPNILLINDPNFVKGSAPTGPNPASHLQNLKLSLPQQVFQRPRIHPRHHPRQLVHLQLPPSRR